MTAAARDDASAAAVSFAAAFPPATRDAWARMNWYAAEPGRLDGVVTNWPAAYLAWTRTRVC